MPSITFQKNIPEAGYVEDDQNTDFKPKSYSTFIRSGLLIGCVVGVGTLAVTSKHMVFNSSTQLSDAMPAQSSLLSDLVNFGVENQLGEYAEKPPVEVLEYCTSTVYVDCEDVPYCADCFEKLEEAVWEFNTDVRFQECGMEKVEDLCHIKESHLIRCTDRYWNCSFPANTGGEMSKYNIWATIQCYCGLGGKSGNT
eukprot:CAMPEP_0185757164 /NCGR_PEP_ID=MMETSP1174-20130828/15629_1 /TAXON_ID=35687 /ORGANISM="Dictyocha speculum, Strain CCMP1381" /LENGTH=196 /DNA_ID=CAMNT_0028436469 /DNA_START=19 /DNA_END=605 /DNA_ORIENTATION=-